MKNVYLIMLSLALTTLAGCTGAEIEPISITTGQGEMAGEVTTNSVIVQSRLTTGNTLVEGDLPGAPGVANFEVDTSADFSNPVRSAWLEAVPENDFIVKAKIEGLIAGTQ